MLLHKNITPGVNKVPWSDINGGGSEMLCGVFVSAVGRPSAVVGGRDVCGCRPMRL